MQILPKRLAGVMRVAVALGIAKPAETDVGRNRLRHFFV